MLSKRLNSFTIISKQTLNQYQIIAIETVNQKTGNLEA